MAENYCYCDPETEICYNHVCIFDCKLTECEGDLCPAYRECGFCSNTDCPCNPFVSA